MNKTKFDFIPNTKTSSSWFSNKKLSSSSFELNGCNHAIYLILKAFLRTSPLQEGSRLYDTAGSLSPPHELVLIHGEAFNEPFLTRIVTPFLEFEGFSHIVYQAKINSSHPKELEITELPLSLGVKLTDLKIEQTFFRPRFSRIFGNSAEPVGSLSITASQSKTSIQSTWYSKKGAEEKSIELITPYIKALGDGAY